jgi:RNA polymerase sigma-70 factor, ECF subfamily
LTTKRRYLRETAREVAVDDEVFDQMSDCADDPATTVARMSENAALKRCLEGLDESKRTSIMLAFIDGYTHEQIAGRLNAPLGTVKAWVRRGLLALRDCLS